MLKARNKPRKGSDTPTLKCDNISTLVFFCRDGQLSQQILSLQCQKYINK